MTDRALTHGLTEQTITSITLSTIAGERTIIVVTVSHSVTVMRCYCAFIDICWMSFKTISDLVFVLVTNGYHGNGSALLSQNFNGGWISL